MLEKAKEDTHTGEGTHIRLVGSKDSLDKHTPTN